MQHDASYPREEPGAGNLHARIREGESRMAELLDQFRPFIRTSINYLIYWRARRDSNSRLSDSKSSALAPPCP